jgi:hypothetical protein
MCVSPSSAAPAQERQNRARLHRYALRERLFCPVKKATVLHACCRLARTTAGLLRAGYLRNGDGWDPLFTRSGNDSLPIGRILSVPWLARFVRLRGLLRSRDGQQLLSSSVTPEMKYDAVWRIFDHLYCRSRPNSLRGRPLEEGNAGKPPDAHLSTGSRHAPPVSRPL